MINGIETLLLQFDIALEPNELSLFRGAINAVLEQHHVLFHNHTEGGYRYAYPLIQYKLLEGKASMIAVGDGIPALQHLLASQHSFLQIGRKMYPLVVERCVPSATELALEDNPQTYLLSQWLPLNDDNFREFQHLRSLRMRLEMLERLFCANVLSMLKGLGIEVTEQIECSIVEVKRQKMVRHKGVQLLSFDLVIDTNITLPLYLGVGKSVSLGHGILMPLK